MARYGSFSDPPDPFIQGGPADPPVPFDPPDDTIQGGPAAPPVPGPDGGDGLDTIIEPPALPPDQDATPGGDDIIGDIPPPPIPPPPAVEGIGPAGIPGSEGSTFARPGSGGALPFRTPAFFSMRPPRFGPGVPFAGGDSTAVSGLGMPNPDDAAEILRLLAAGRRR